MFSGNELHNIAREINNNKAGHAIEMAYSELLAGALKTLRGGEIKKWRGYTLVFKAKNGEAKLWYDNVLVGKVVIKGQWVEGKFWSGNTLIEKRKEKI